MAAAKGVFVGSFSVRSGPPAGSVEMTDGMAATTAGLRRDEAGDRSRIRSRAKEIDGLRGLAALMVLVSHAAAMSGPANPHRLFSLHTWASRGGSGVSLFFVVSGFLIAGPFLGSLVAGTRRPFISGYAIRRAARILPAYWVALAAIVILAPPVGGVRWWQVPVHAALIHGWVPGDSGALLFVAWSLSAEGAFYVLVPVAALLLARRPGAHQVSYLAAVIAGVFIAGWGLVALADLQVVNSHFHLPVSDWVQIEHNSPLPFLASFCPGMLLVLALTPQASGRGGGWTMLRWLTQAKIGLPFAIGLALASFVFFVDASWPVQDVVGGGLLSIAYGLLLGVVIERGHRMRLLRLLAPVGVISYGIYLWHWVVKTVIEHDAPSLISHGTASADLRNTVLLLAITVPLATGSWLLIERPAIHWAAAQARRLTGRDRAATKPATASV